MKDTDFISRVYNKFQENLKKPLDCVLFPDRDDNTILVTCTEVGRQKIIEYDSVFGMHLTKANEDFYCALLVVHGNKSCCDTAVEMSWDLKDHDILTFPFEKTN